MLNRLIQWSLANRGLVLVISALVLVLGIFTALRLPVEVLPDLTKPTVVILTEAPGLAPEEVETRVTQPIETALMGVVGLTRLRSNSDVSLSLVYAEFDWNSDLQKSRLLVQERLQAVREQLPEGIQPVDALPDRVARDQRGIDGANRGADHPFGFDAGIVQGLVHAHLVGAQGATALKHQHHLSGQAGLGLRAGTAGGGLS